MKKMLILIMLIICGSFFVAEKIVNAGEIWEEGYKIVCNYQDGIVKEGDTIFLTVESKSNMPSYVSRCQWFKDGEPIITGNGKYSVGQSSLTIYYADSTDRGRYSAKVMDGSMNYMTDEFVIGVSQPLNINFSIQNSMEY